MTELSDVELMSLKCHVFVSFQQRASISQITLLSYHMDTKTKKQALIKTKLFKGTKTPALMSIFWLKNVSFLLNTCVNGLSLFVRESNGRKQMK